MLSKHFFAKNTVFSEKGAERRAFDSTRVCLNFQWVIFCLPESGLDSISVSYLKSEDTVETGADPGNSDKTNVVLVPRETRKFSVFRS